jgi:tRNA-dihydrouridine synthase B
MSLIIIKLSLKSKYFSCAKGFRILTCVVLNPLIEMITGHSVLAPMAGITDRPFRLTVKQYGVSLMFTELVSAEGLIRESEKTFELMRFTDHERPIGIQIFGNQPDMMARAAQIAESFKPDVIDLNFGCPARKVVNGGSGAAILTDLQLLKRIVHTVVNAVHTPVSCKIRSGWNEGSIVAVEAARIIQKEGAALLTLHPRTKSQGFAGHADWRLIQTVKNLLDIPVIGNGDIFIPHDAARMFDETGCDAVMIGRAAMGHPWIFKQTDHLLETGALLPNPDLNDRVRVCLRHYDLALRLHGIPRGLKEMRKHIGWYLKGMPGVSKIRSQLMTLENPDAVQALLIAYSETLEKETGESRIKNQETRNKKQESRKRRVEGEMDA